MTLKELDAVTTGIYWEGLLPNLVKLDPEKFDDLDAYYEACDEELSALRRDNPNPRGLLLRELGDWEVREIRPYDDQIKVTIAIPVFDEDESWLCPEEGRS